MLLLALWLLLEQHVPDRADAEGTLAALYRLEGVFSALGVGVAVSFGAYLAGSLSVFIFNRLLRTALRTAPSSSGWRNTLTDDSSAAIQLVSVDSLSRIRAALSLSGHDIDDVLVQSAAGHKMMQQSDAFSWRTPRRRSVRRPRARALGPGYAEPESEPRLRWEAALEQLVRDDLEVVAKTRLLGEKPDLYSAVDRLRAEVEFRLAVAPPLGLLAVAAAVRQANAVSLGLVALGLVLSIALFLDAVRQQRAANELLVDLLSTGVIKSPALERVEERARALAAQDELASRAVAERVDDAIKKTLRDLKHVGTSEPTLAQAAVNSAAEARKLSEAFRSEFPDPSPFQSLERAVSLLEQAAADWLAYNQGELPRSDDGDQTARRDPQETAAAARGAHLEFVHEVRESLARLSERPPQSVATR